MTPTVYQQRQWMKVLWLSLPAITLLVMALETSGQDTATRLRALLLLALINGVVLVVVGCLSIHVDDVDLRWHFGLLGWPRWRVPLAEISHVERCQSHWTEGWGIRLTTQGMLYNAAGFGAVAVTRIDGRRFRLGSAEPDQLYAHLQQRIASVRAAAPADKP